MDLKSALTKLKTGGAKLAVPFLYCESDSKGKPLLLIGAITPEQKTKALTGAKSQKIATGKMSINGQGDLCLQQPKGTALSSLLKGVATAATNAGARALFNDVQIGAAAETANDAAALKDSPDNNNNLASEKAPAPSPAKTAPAKPSFPASNYETSPAPPSSAPGKSKVASGYSDLHAEVASAPPKGKRDGQAPPAKTNAPAHHYTSANAPAPVQPPANPSRNVQPRGKFPIANYHTDLPGAPQPPVEVNEEPAPATESSSGDDNYVDTGPVQIGPPPIQTDEEGKTYEETARKKSPGKEGMDDDAPPPAKIELTSGGRRKYPDVLRKSPAMAQVLDERDAILKRVPDVSPDDLARLEELEKEIELAQRQLNKSGMVPQPMGEEYRGEDGKVGWRAPKPNRFRDDPNWTPEERQEAKRIHAEEVKRYEAFRDSASTVTGYFTEEERKKSAVSVNAEGKFVDADGNLVTSRDEYVMDADSGQLHQFTPQSQKGKKEVLNADGVPVTQAQNTHHSSVLSGKEVGGAGGMEIHDGVVQKITNSSGHYKPGIGPMVQTVETLLRQGILLNQDWSDKNGQPLEGKVKKLYDEVRALQQRVEKKTKADANVDVTADRTQIDKSLALLAKLGAGPINKVRDANVGFLDIKTPMTGKDVKVKAASVKNIPAEEFLRTGGGNTAQAEAKKKALDELMTRTNREREEFDTEYAVTGEGSADPSDDDLKKAITGLNPSYTDDSTPPIKPGKEEVPDT